jgi:hypothetical protein
MLNNTLITDTAKHPLIVLLSTIISAMYLKKKWYEYLGLWMLAFAFILFIAFAFSTRNTLFSDIDGLLKNNEGDQEELFSADGPIKTIVDIFTPIFNKIVGETGFAGDYVRVSSLIAILVVCIFILITISLILFLVSSTAIVKKKSKDDDERPLIVTDLKYLKQNIIGKVNGKELWQNFKSGFDALLVGIFALILILYGNQFLPIVLPKTVNIGLIGILLLMALISSIIALVYSGGTLRVRTRLDNK